MPPLVVHQQQLQLRWLLFVATLAAVAHSGYGAHCFVVLHFWPITTPLLTTHVLCVNRSGRRCLRVMLPTVKCPLSRGRKLRSQVRRFRAARGGSRR